MHTRFITMIAFGALMIALGVYFAMPAISKNTYDSDQPFVLSQEVQSQDNVAPLSPETTETINPSSAQTSGVTITHIPTPKQVKALYMSSWVAATPSFRAKLVELIDQTELNTVVLDIKDSTGKIAFLTHDPKLTALGATENRIKDIDAFIAMLHSKNIYVIGRISVFQDPYMTQHKPEWAIKKKSDGTVWKDFKGLSFFDPTNDEVHAYTIALAKESYARGFDEINFDYVRFPSDGKISDIAYPHLEGETRADVMESFFKKLSSALADSGMVTSADLFGLVTTSTDDLGIGQVLEKALPYFDYICPMVYPSHFGAGWNGFKNPAEYPYEVIKISMTKAVERAKAINQDPLKLRPWLQDFNIGATYTADMIKAQIKGTYDSGLDSWMLWSAANTYTRGGLLPQ